MKVYTLTDCEMRSTTISDVFRENRLITSIDGLVGEELLGRRRLASI